MAKIADFIGIKRHHLSEILHRRRGVGPFLGEKLEDGSRTILGECIPFREWILNKRSKHPAFFGDYE
jgi:hypothetical protein